MVRIGRRRFRQSIAASGGTFGCKVKLSGKSIPVDVREYNRRVNELVRAEQFLQLGNHFRSMNPIIQMALPGISSRRCNECLQPRTGERKWKRSREGQGGIENYAATADK